MKDFLESHLENPYKLHGHSDRHSKETLSNHPQSIYRCTSEHAHLLGQQQFLSTIIFHFK